MGFFSGFWNAVRSTVGAVGETAEGAVGALAYTVEDAVLSHSCFRAGIALCEESTL